MPYCEFLFEGRVWDALDYPVPAEEASKAMAGAGLRMALGYQGLQILWPDAIGTAGADPVQFKHLYLFCWFFLIRS